MKCRILVSVAVVLLALSFVPSLMGGGCDITAGCVDVTGDFIFPGSAATLAGMVVSLLILACLGFFYLSIRRAR